MRTRWLALVGGSVWLATVVVVAMVSDLGAASAVLFALLGLLTVAGLGVLLTIHRLLLRTDANAVKAAKATARAGKPPVARLVREEIGRVASTLDSDMKRTFRQVEALHNLYAMIDIEHALPASRGWPASPDLLLFLVDLVDRHRPKVIVECGSGLSTLCLALAMRRFGINGKVIALEHLEEYAAQTAELVRRHGVADLVEVREAPLEPTEVGDVQVDWYSRTAWDDLRAVDLLFVDGPPSNKRSPQARHPALPFLAERLTAGAHIVLDDYQRTDERNVVKRWQDEFPDRLSLETIQLEKGAALLTLN